MDSYVWHPTPVFNTTHKKLGNAIFWSMWLLIVFVSVWDSVLTVVHRDVMVQHELNPVGLWLIILNDGGVSYLLIAKAVGTVLVTSVLAAIHEDAPRQAMTITMPISCFQLWLLAFLSFA